MPVTSSGLAANVQVALVRRRGFHSILRLSPGRLGGSGCHGIHRPLPGTVPVSVTITALTARDSGPGLHWQHVTLGPGSARGARELLAFQ